YSFFAKVHFCLFTGMLSYFNNDRLYAGIKLICSCLLTDSRMNNTVQSHEKICRLFSGVKILGEQSLVSDPMKRI
ncbi:MAG TPA: hypothetical protein P5273_10460, partial [Syntrophomonadaceae bacterium]|nr:hypothetical protein [Syntrophomonadaceae bacterium]